MVNRLHEVSQRPCRKRERRILGGARRGEHDHACRGKLGHEPPQRLDAVDALQDVYDALISRRVYKPPFSHEKAREMILAERGRHFDPAVVDAFADCHAELQAIARRFADADMLLSPELPPLMLSASAAGPD